MMKSTGSIMALALFGATAASAQTSPIQGDWVSEGGGVRVAPCAAGPGFCVTVTSGSRAATSMSDIVGQVVIRNLVQDQSGVWRGRYVADQKNLPATVSVRDARHASFTVCLANWIPFSCKTEQIVRSGPLR